MANPQSNQQPNQNQQNRQPGSQKPGFGQQSNPNKDAENKFRPKAEDEEEGSERGQNR